MNDPIAILKRDHREAAAILRQLKESKRPSATRRRLTAKVTSALQLHMEIEESLIYPLVARDVDEDEEQEAETEHLLALEGLERMGELVDDGGFGAALAMVTAGIRHDVREEESEMFPELKATLTREELLALGDEVAKAKRRGHAD